MEANVTAAVPSMVDMLLSMAPAAKKAPAKVIPEIALAPDISGVCNVAGTFEMSSKPRKIDNTSINVRNTTSTLTTPLVSQVLDSFVDDLSIMSDQAPLDDVVIEVKVECTGFLVPVLGYQVEEVG